MLARDLLTIITVSITVPKGPSLYDHEITTEELAALDGDQGEPGRTKCLPSTIHRYIKQQVP